MLKLYARDLKKLRESKGISIPEISAETRINTKFLNLMENGEFGFQPDAYIRSFLKEYARAIDEDEKKILNDYDKAKAGFYSPKKFEPDETVKSDVKLNVKATPVDSITGGSTAEPLYRDSLKSERPDYYKTGHGTTEQEYSNKSTAQKIFLVMLILAVICGIYFLIDYLNSSGDKKSDIKPKTFNEISSEYENKISGYKDSMNIRDSLRKLSRDSLRLVIVALKDIRVIVSVDDDAKRIDEELSAKDSLIVKASSGFRFSTSNGPNTEIYLNGKFLRKPVTTRGSTIKDLIITKEGINSKKSDNDQE